MGNTKGCGVVRGDGGGFDGMRGGWRGMWEHARACAGGCGVNGQKMEGCGEDEGMRMQGGMCVGGMQE